MYFLCCPKNPINLKQTNTIFLINHYLNRELLLSLPEIYYPWQDFTFTFLFANRPVTIATSIFQPAFNYSPQ